MTIEKQVADLSKRVATALRSSTSTTTKFAETSKRITAVSEKLTGKIKTLRLRMDSISSTAGIALKMARSNSEKLEALNTRVDSLSETELEKRLLKSEERINSINERVQLMLVKHTTATEVVNIVEDKRHKRRVALAIINAFDLPDEWWNARRKNTTVADFFVDAMEAMNDADER